MNTDYVEYIPLKLGAIAKYSKTICQQDIVDFAKISGDDNPLHLDKDYAKSTRFKRPIAHGMLTASFISTIVGTKFARLIYLSQSLNFCQPVYVADKITVSAEVIKEKKGKDIFTLETICKNQDGIIVISGEAVVMHDR